MVFVNNPEGGGRRFYFVSFLLLSLLIVTATAFATEKLTTCVPGYRGRVGQYPPEKTFVNVTGYPYCAKGDGRSDDTEAIQRAILDSLMLGRYNGASRDRVIPTYYGEKILYLPEGTYLVSDTLWWTKEGHGLMRARVVGDGAGRSVIRLRNNAPGFTNEANPKSLLLMSTIDGNNWAHNNYVSDLTVDVGKGNVGAIALRFNANNNGGLFRLELRSSDPHHLGKYGLALMDNWPGPFLVKQLTVKGFDYGVYFRGQQYGVTFKDLTLHEQKRAGMFSDNYPSIDGLESRNSYDVPVIQANSENYRHTLVTDGDLEYTGPGKAQSPAIKISKGRGVFRSITTRGYSTAIYSTRG